MATATRTLPQSRLHTTDSVFTPLALRGKKKTPQLPSLDLVHERTRRQKEHAEELARSPKTLAELRAKKPKYSDARIRYFLKEIEQLAAANGGYVPSCKTLRETGHNNAYDCMMNYPAPFAHLPREYDKKFEIYKAHNSGKPEPTSESTALVRQAVLAPAKYKSIADYDIPCARFSPTELRISEGIDDQQWMEIGRGLAHVCMSTFWWIGDFILYGKRHYGARVSYDLAQQATAFSRAALYRCVRVAQRYPPERRVEALTFYHHSMLTKFQPELADKLLQDGVEYGYTARQLREMGNEIIGETKLEKEWVKLSLVISAEAYQELLTRSLDVEACAMNIYGRNRVKWMIGDIVSDWLHAKKRKENEDEPTTLAGIETEIS